MSSLEQRRTEKKQGARLGKAGKTGKAGSDADLILPVRRKDGKRRVFETGLLCSGIATALLFVAYVTPWWVQSWRRVFSPFRHMGLWEACFAGMILYADPTQKSYHGCWWILAPEYYDIRGWLMPGWFVFTQVATTIAILAEIFGFGIMFIIWLGTGGRRKQAKKPAARGQHSKDPKKESITLLQTGMWLTVSSAILMTVSCVNFGVGHYLDRRWLPNPDFNYMSWSYGLAVLSTFFQIFAMICQVTYVMIVRQEMREPPRDMGLRGYSAAYPIRGADTPAHARPQAQQQAPYQGPRYQGQQAPFQGPGYQGQQAPYQGPGYQGQQAPYQGPRYQGQQAPYQGPGYQGRSQAGYTRQTPVKGQAPVPPSVARQVPMVPTTGRAPPPPPPGWNYGQPGDSFV